MSDRPLWITDIGRLALGKPVLLVEGEDDVVLFEHFRDGSLCCDIDEIFVG